MKENLLPPMTPDAANEAHDQYVDAPTLLEMLFPPECRPSLRWLRSQQKARRIPFVKLGHLVFFSPAQVRRALQNKSN